MQRQAVRRERLSLSNLTKKKSKKNMVIFTVCQSLINIDQNAKYEVLLQAAKNNKKSFNIRRDLWRRKEQRVTSKFDSVAMHTYGLYGERTKFLILNTKF